MKTLFYKDLRENFRLALVGLAILTLLLALSYQNSLGLMRNIALGRTSAIDTLQPLLSQSLLVELLFFCGIFGAALGWLQTRNEAHRDLWAFLIHRPVTRTHIFWGKASAGLCLYALGAGLPLLGFIGYVRQPGHVAAPFEWGMTLPVAAAFLTGIAYYFAGQLTGLRQARWFGSRTFSVWAALLASAAVVGVAAFWQAVAVILPVTLLLAVAVWGAYLSGGFYRGQPVFGRLALTASLLCGSAGVLALALGVTSPLFRPSQPYAYVWHIYRLSLDGSVSIMASRDGEESFTDLAGRPLLDPATGQKIDAHKFNDLSAPGTTAIASREGRSWSYDRYLSTAKYFTLWTVSDKVLWYVDRHGKLTGYNSLTCRDVGDLVPPAAAGAGRFIRSGYWNNYFNAYNPPAFLATSNTVYQVDLARRALKPVLTTPDTNPIAGFSEYKISDQTNGVLVLTHDTIQLIDSNGTNLLSLPYQPDCATYPQIEVFSLLPRTTNRFVVWFNPDYQLNLKSGWKLPIHALWLSPASQIVKTADLPALQEKPSAQSAFDEVTDCLVPPMLQFMYMKNGLGLARLLPAVLCLLIAWRVARRYRLPEGATAGWLVFIFLLGVPGLLTFFCAPDWPSRETCPACKKLRTVDREHCEHCGAGFAPPEKIGIEIFEPLKSL